MMSAVSLARVFGVAVLGLGVAGCGSSSGRICHHAPLSYACETRANPSAGGLSRLRRDPCHPIEAGSDVVLAADVEGASGIASQPTSRPAKRPAYTAPASTIQQLSLVTILAAPSAAVRSAGAGREAGESSLSSPTGLSGGGLAGLGAPQPRTLTAVVGQPGLQRGFAAGLGFARPDNVFTPRANPLSGPTGRCQELVRVGFFQTQSACEHHFRR
ncbi:MAG: hypothetical protein JXA69_21190 [Phycisphaerae bacterium]|nr:hypothetical protein [Phycisphaerae bacterium]